MEKHCRAWQGTDEHMKHAQCMLDTCGYKHTLRICNTYCFTTSTLVARMRLKITLYVHSNCLFFILPILKYFDMSLKLVFIRSIVLSPHP